MTGDSSPPWIWPRAAYVHIPFCAHHCCYCDFAVVAGRDDAADAYLSALQLELERLGEPQPIDTLFVGGGTPTHLAAKQLEKLLVLLHRWFVLRPGHEASVEANPRGLADERLRLLAEHDINRISLGVQSFQPHVLKFLEREHSAEEARRCIVDVGKWIPHVSIDLIFGVPGQTLEQWEADLRTAVDLGVKHVSTYGLTYEKGTRLWKDRERGAVRALDEEGELDMYLRAMEVLESAGLEQYEISSFAAPGSRCRHNQVYWANHAYFGFGMGAARYVQGKRETNTRDLQTYLKRMFAGESPVFQSEELNPEDRARETLALNLRRVEGVVRDAFLKQTGFAVDSLAGEVIARHCDSGFLEDTGRAIRLTRRGRCVADRVIEDLL